MTARIEARIERFAHGFRDRILARATMNAVSSWSGAAPDDSCVKRPVP